MSFLFKHENGPRDQDAVNQGIKVSNSHWPQYYKSARVEKDHARDLILSYPKKE